MSAGWIRVTKADPCAVCGKPDWCTRAEFGSGCMRVESPKPMQNGGWFHPAGGPVKPPPPRLPPERTTTIDAGTIMARFAAATWAEMVEELAESLGVAADALERLGVAWATGHSAWAFPMRDWLGNIIGIRLRDVTGHKWAVKGSRAGLFYAEGKAQNCYVCEGPTDTAAGLSMGLDCIGRPSCLGSEPEVVRLVNRKGARRVILISDNDGPGLRGAQKLQACLPVPSMVWVPPCKDLREFVTSGGTAQLIESLTRSTVWTQPRKD